jgi:CBS domain-containing protein
MKISDCMSRDVQTISPEDSIQEAASLMTSLDVGSLPVGQDDRLVGMVTDRDIVIRAVCAGKGADTPIRDVMSNELLYCFDDQDIDTVAKNMGEQKVRRLPVVDRDKRLVGIISLGDIAGSEADLENVGETLSEISEPGGAHSQDRTPAIHPGM